MHVIMKWFYRGLVAVCTLILLLQGLNWAARRANTLPSVPNPNGYDRLLVAAGKVSLPSKEMIEVTTNEVLEISRQNAAVLENLRTDLAAQSAVPLRASSGWVEQHYDDLSKLKRLAVAVNLDARALTLQGRTNEAALRYLDVIVLGQAVARGGVVADALTGIAIETIGNVGLRSELKGLSSAELSSLARALGQAESRRDATETILQTEKRWVAASFGLVSRLGGLLNRKAMTRGREDFARRYDENRRRTGRLILFVAARAFELDHARAASGPAELVPKYLPAVPVDAVTGKAFEDIVTK